MYKTKKSNKKIQGFFLDVFNVPCKSYKSDAETNESDNPRYTDTHPIAFSHWDLSAGISPVFTNHLSLKLGAVNTFQYLA